jgi:hypothetical protein
MPVNSMLFADCFESSCDVYLHLTCWSILLIKCQQVGCRFAVDPCQHRDCWLQVPQFWVKWKSLISERLADPFFGRGGRPVLCLPHNYRSLTNAEIMHIHGPYDHWERSWGPIPTWTRVMTSAFASHVNSSLIPQQTYEEATILEFSQFGSGAKSLHPVDYAPVQASFICQWIYFPCWLM